MKVLLVDDSTLVRMQLKRCILAEFSDIRFDDAANGIEALEKHRKFKPEVIILDYIIPSPDGMAVLEILRKFDKKVRVIMLTTLGKQKFVCRKLMDSGASAVLAKPMTREVLVEIRNLLQKYMDTGENIEENSR